MYHLECLKSWNNQEASLTVGSLRWVICLSMGVRTISRRDVLISCRIYWQYSELLSSVFFEDAQTFIYSCFISLIFNIHFGFWLRVQILSCQRVRKSVMQNLQNRIPIYRKSSFCIDVWTNKETFSCENPAKI